MGSKAFKPTLKNTLALVEKLGNPHNSLNFVHVAGSNGKGSVCSMLSSILTESGYKVGLFTSPHIQDFTERIRVNGKTISEDAVIDFVNQVKALELDFEPSFFEITLTMALVHFKEQNCDICVIETGLGGRFDATNVITPLVSSITNISLEHTNMLGDTIEKIAYEKAGIIKNDGITVLGEMNPLARQVMVDEIENSNSTLFENNKYQPGEFKLPLLGEYQQQNFNTVLGICEALSTLDYIIDSTNIQNGLDKLHSNTGFYGRLQVIQEKPRVIFDVSHNADGIKATLDTIEKTNTEQLYIVYGTSNDKDVTEIFSLFPNTASYYFTEFTNPRSLDINSLRELSKHLTSTQYFTQAGDAYTAAVSAANEKDTILVIGSFFLIADFY